MFTFYESDSKITEKIMKQNGIQSNEEYRKFLMNNAEKIMKVNNVTYSEQSFAYVPNNDPDHFFMNLPRTDNIPHLYDSESDIAHKYGYETNIAKSKYLSRHNLNARKTNVYKK